MGYHRNYRRPYYNRRPYYPRRNSDFGIKFFVAICALFLFAIFSSSSGWAILGVLLNLALFVGIIWLFVKGIKKLFSRNSQSIEIDTTYISQQNIAQVNSKKHGCKCYMEELSDGEQEVANTLSRDLSYKDYFIFNNLIVPSENNGSTQIDHIVVSKFGIFVIESKDFNGWIFGDKDQPKWTQSLPGGKKKFQFQNPIHQNYGHIMALKTLMPFVADNFYSIVVFTDKSEIKTPPIENVLHLPQLVEYIKKCTTEKLTERDIQLAIGKLSYTCQTADITAPEHIENIRANKLI